MVQVVLSGLAPLVCNLPKLADLQSVFASEEMTIKYLQR
jgi:hypothetical protein